MGNNVPDVDDTAVSGLKSAKSAQRLKQISSLRARGISENIDLPQLVVCGAQSAGKSSVLEGITGIPFPREAISATVIPGSSREETVKASLQAYQRTINGFKELPDVIAKAGALMGLRGYGDNDLGPAFVEDILRIKVTGPSGLHLSIVDLPGLISTPSEEQTEDDMETVHRIIDSYVEKPRTIILAIVQAGNDIANQSVIRKSKLFDKAGQRTVGIITKPDLINEGAEERIAALAKNQDTTKLQLGFFLLKNPTPKERKNEVTASQRSETELRYFQSSPWRDQKLDASRVGVNKLKTFLQALLDRHIEKELPKVGEEIKAMIRTIEQEIVSLPPERPTVGHLRMFLSDLAMQYHGLATAALNGDYHTGHAPFFTINGTINESNRLRALIHSLNTKFSDNMRDRGEKLKLGYPQNTESWIKSTGPVHLFKKEKKVHRAKKANCAALPSLDVYDCGPAENDREEYVPASADLQNASDTDQKLVTESETKAWVRNVSILPKKVGSSFALMAVSQVYLTTRGRELPGNYNHVLLTELFHHQSKPWQRIATDHVEHVHDSIITFVKKAITHLRVEDHVLAEIQEGIDVTLQESKLMAEKELMTLWADEQQHPITCNHYYVDNIQESRLNYTQKAIEQALEKVNVDPDGFAPPAIGNMSADMLITAVRQNVIVNMDEQACSEALEALHAYYKARPLSLVCCFRTPRDTYTDLHLQVAMKTFVDNVCRQVIERHLLRNLPDIFSPQLVAMYTDEDLERIAGERPDTVEKRKQLREQLTNLKAGLDDLRK
ncbi:hypothetical protein LTR12_017127 [Friedmanniomyces endolithicus]|nr:hypothetical protein LTR12_017127 [Friedmanniomyces endolithicus]